MKRLLFKTKPLLLLVIALTTLLAPMSALATGFGISPAGPLEITVPSDGAATQAFTVHGLTGTLLISLENIPLVVEPASVSVTDGQSVTITIRGDGTNSLYTGKILFIAMAGENIAVGVKVRTTIRVGLSTEIVPRPQIGGGGGGSGGSYGFTTPTPTPVISASPTPTPTVTATVKLPASTPTGTTTTPATPTPTTATPPPSPKTTVTSILTPPTPTQSVPNGSPTTLTPMSPAAPATVPTQVSNAWLIWLLGFITLIIIVTLILLIRRRNQAEQDQ